MLAAALTSAALIAPLAGAMPAGQATTPPYATFGQVTSDADWARGTSEGTTHTAGDLTFGASRGTRTLAGKAYQWSRWTSSWFSPGQPFTQLVPSWNAKVPAGSVLEVQTRVRTASGSVSGFKNMGRWVVPDGGFRRTSMGSQSDSVARVATDTLVTTGAAATGYQMRVVLLRRPGTPSPSLSALSTVVSRPHAVIHTTRQLAARTLAVPKYSQMTHRGQYPGYGGGGEAWCSPTSLSMVLGFYGALPPASAYTWVNGSYSDRFVDEVARRTYDYGYRGTGNWPFNTGYAASRGTWSFVTRLDTMREAEQFIAAGIPLEASISFSSGQLSGSPISSTPGHLVVIVGFTQNGDVVVNDPAASTNAGVRRVYDRAQFERAWLGGSQGTVYVVRKPGQPLPTRAGQTNW